MNPSLKFLLAVLIALEISFTNTWTVNLGLAVIGLLVILSSRPSLKRLVLLFFVPLIPAVALAVAILLQSNAGIHFALVLFTRIYAYVFVGSAATLTTSVADLVMSLEQNAHIPSKFAYGFLGAFNLLPKIVSEVNVIRAAGNMRGQALHIWSPQLYFKAILASLDWSENLAEAMTSHGFSEDAPRTYFKQIRIRWWDWLIVIGSLALLQVALFGLHLQ
ncbi:MAG TPA: energy-coupling factor transporter transmembrane protein EcfT [Lactobacillus sp.]|uniref:Energy-coupling factor transporter transmembrane protein n=1 Tax=Secundilactobacillus silagincola TaxID=1714681 RepID=A0A1Z5H4U5_9LACO|nr:energy-coupling factor transporter transmembrane component T [Secundilactobacillus silagincola]GAT18310.1 energy-coupling factor transporter transmembrane protein [Secundilactobacillus silagincola]HBF74057.1 energy-coupling factor transporter transmembrane protein EcfT [Lactobacillus sp.]